MNDDEKTREELIKEAWTLILRATDEQIKTAFETALGIKI